MTPTREPLGTMDIVPDLTLRDLARLYDATQHQQPSPEAERLLNQLTRWRELLDTLLQELQTSTTLGMSRLELASAIFAVQAEAGSTPTIRPRDGITFSLQVMEQPLECGQCGEPVPGGIVGWYEGSSRGPLCGTCLEENAPDLAVFLRSASEGENPA